MKKVTITLAMIALLVFAKAQNGNNICVFNAMSNYNTGGGPSELERGIKCSDEATVNEATANDKKTWFYRGQLYTLVFIDTVLNKKYGTAGLEAVKAFKKLYDLNDPKFKDWEDAFKYIIPLATNIFNTGVDQFQAKNYAQAYKYFYAIKDLDAIFKGKNKTSAIELATALKNAAICAEDAGDTVASLQVYKEWLDVSPNPFTYRGYALGLKRTDKAAAEKVVDEGLAKFPTDANLLVEKINFYLEGGEYVKALTYVNNLLAIEPKNDGAMFIKGLAYEKIGNEDSVIYYYKKSAETNAKNEKPLNNLGAWYVNKANAMAEAMNKLGNSAEDMKKFDEMKKQRRALYLEAKPYLEKAKAIDPSDAQISRTLKQIELYTAE